MKTTTNNNLQKNAQQAYTFAEVLVSVLAVAFVLVSMYAAFSSGFNVIRSSRENLRATQIMVQRTEDVRLYTWSQLLNTNAYLVSPFTEVYDPLGPTNGGFKYYGTLTLLPASSMPAAYRANMRVLEISVRWTNTINGSLKPHSRALQTLVARYGVANYVYGPR